MKSPSNYNTNNNNSIFPYSRILLLLSTLLPLIHSLPLSTNNNTPQDDIVNSQSVQVSYLIISVALVLLGGVFAGLTLGLMGQDEVYLKVISTSGTQTEQRLAKKVLTLFNHGKHKILVTLLLSNVITNETLPIVLDRSLNGGGWQAVVFSTVLIVIFGEVIPQSICVKYGLEVGAFFGPFVLILMYTFFPIVYPTARLLDYILGESHGTMYKKSGLKTLVTLHKTMGVERLSRDEVTIISAVLDLKEKSVFEIMTPMENVYTLASDTILDADRIQHIFNSGFSRIPIHLPNESTNFIGMLLVRVLISYDSSEKLTVSSFPLATLPETRPTTSCLNILNYFQEGKSHMCIVSDNPGSSSGSIGVVTLEDVIEELIGEEIVDESDVFIDIHKKIKRNAPAPLLSKRHLTPYLHKLYNTKNELNQKKKNINNNSIPLKKDDNNNKSNSNTNSSSFPPFQPQLNLSSNKSHENILINQLQDIKPSNLASNPLKVKKSFVTIKNLHDSDSDKSISPPLNNNNISNYGSITKKKTIPKLTKHSDPVTLSQKQKEEISNIKNEQQAISNFENINSDNNNNTINHQINNGLINDQQQPQFVTGSIPQDRDSRKSITNGIVESIITVQGLPKTIIEPKDNND